MQNNNSNNATQWKQRLEDFEEDLSIDLNASWEKLQEKKPVKKQRSRGGFYWLAAASVVLIAFVAINWYHSGNTAGIGDPVAKTDTAKAHIENKTLVISNQEPVVVQETPVVKNTIPAAAEKPAVLKNDPAREIIPLMAIEDPTVQNTSWPDSVSSPVIVLKAAPKKLKLVHINEINAGKDTNGLVQQDAKPYFPITYPTKQVYTNAGNNNKTSKDNLIRIKLN